MKKYIVRVNIPSGNYRDELEKNKIFEGESINDPLMIKEIILWLYGLDRILEQDNYNFEEWRSELECTESIGLYHGVKIYEIGEAHLIPNVWDLLEEYSNERSRLISLQYEEDCKNQRRREYERLKKEFGTI